MNDSRSPSLENEPKYRIGAVCRLTGLSQHVLRVWEKRYGAVEPERSESGRRLYSDRDVNRLSLLKALVDRGQAIGSIAGLDPAELEQRLGRFSRGTPVTARGSKPTLAMIGASLAATFRECAASEIVNLAGHFTDMDGFAKRQPASGMDIVVVEWPNIQPESAAGITRLANRLNARHLIVAYDYGPRSVIERIRNDRITPLRLPLDTVALEAVAAWRFGDHRQDDTMGGPPPARLFDDGDLSWLATQSSTIDCECPMHLAQLINRLLNFEHYSAECESRNAEDAALHGYLRNTTAQARHLMERALVRVVEFENLDPANRG